MNKNQTHSSDACELLWIRQSRVFQQWESVKQDILLHKWYESEKAGHDIGWERACVDWMIHSSRDDRRS